MTPANHQDLCRLRSKQGGAVLVVSLVFLGVLAVLGIGAMDTARLEAIMGRNTRLHLGALSDAELVLEIAEQDLEAQLANPDSLDFELSGDHYYYPPLFDGPETAERDWDFTSASVADGRYVVEYWGRRTPAGESMQIGTATAGSFVHLFEVSAQSESGKGARRNVQSVFVSADAP